MKTTLREVFRIAFAGLLLMVCSACGGGTGTPMSTPAPMSTSTPVSTYMIGGTVQGLTGSGLVLENNAGDDLAVYSGPFTFTDGLTNGAAYAVTVKTQPSSPPQNCVVINSSGSVGAADVTDVSVECISRFAYAANAGDNTISAYSIDSSGALTAIGTPVPTGTSPRAIAARPDGQYVYVVNGTSNNISVYAVNATSGTLTAIPGSPFSAGTNPQALSFDVLGSYLYVVNQGSDNLSAYAVNASTGALTALSPPNYTTGMRPCAVSVGPGEFVFVANNGGSNDISVFAISAGTGALTPVAGSPFAVGGNPHSLVITPYEPWDYGMSIFVYTANFDGTSSSVSGFVLEQSSGVLTPLSGSPFPVAVSNYIATDSTGSYLYVTTGASVVGYSIDSSTGLIQALAGFPVASGANAYSVTVDPSNQVLYVGNDGADNITGYRIDLPTGELTPTPGSPFSAGSHSDFITTL